MRLATWLVAFLLLGSSPAQALSPKEIYKKCGSAVVLILGSDDGKQGSGGTGSVISPDGKVVTNAHVVMGHDTNQPFKIIYVFLKPDRITGDNSKDLTRRYKGRVLAYSPPEELDLALVQIEDAPAAMPSIAFADPDKVDVGDEVVAIGHPEQGGLWTLTTGAISTVIANYGRVKGKNVFQTEASVNRGNSGGPLLDSDGNMVGINTMIARQAADGVAITAVNFSLKSSVAVSWLSLQGMGLAYAPKTAEQPVMVAMAPRADRAPAPEAAASAPSVERVAPAVERPVPSAAGEPAGRPAQAPSESAERVRPVAPAPAAQAERARPSPSTASPSASAPATSAPAVPAPAATIVVAEKAPARPADVKNVAQQAHKEKANESVVKGKPLDPAKAKPSYVTEKRPFNLDDLRKAQMKELEDMMKEMRTEDRNSSPNAGDGMGLW